MEISYEASKGYAAAEKDGLVVFISIVRDKDLIAKGLLRDLARHLQQLRKERHYNPTDILQTACVAGLDEEELTLLMPLKQELEYLVRVKSIVISKNKVDNVIYKEVEIDSRQFHISVE